MSKDYLLVVDDHVGVRRLLCEFLSREGFCVKEAPDGHTALQIVREEKPELTFLDLKMPGLSGIETLNKLNELRLNIPVVVMSASTQDKAVMTAVRNGFVKHFLPKPFDLENLRLVLHSLISDSLKTTKL
ncbi:response regulator [Desulfosporosinus sp.]|uniref:response regulator n=1 Tax=Desulfosporosinus sp. TaxID=157907 RepID=UPI0025C5C390|nr:response regulator [Desulfosporosinus sp.]MBC2721760.1 response regulator [Desulfosporosinus sp.]MBC2726190.1 response regulator [Desulfosporosinus sp.]